MEQLSRDDLMNLEQYHSERPEFRQRVLAHKEPRKVQVGPHATLYFEDRLTMQYQIQEMLRVERIFEPEGIQDELDAYNPLIPDGSNLKATFMIEYPDAEERKIALAKLVGIEDHIRIEVADLGAAEVHADEDLERDSEEKTSAVHFVRFEFTPEQIEAFKGGAEVTIRIGHPAYQHSIDLSRETRASLAADFD